MLVPTFTLKLGHDLLPGLATVGKYDGKHPSLTCATLGNKVLIHAPHDVGAGTAGTGSDPVRCVFSLTPTPPRFLSVNQQVTALSAGRVGPFNGAPSGDTLFVGMPVNLMSYNVEANSGHFYRDVPDGVSAMALGTVGTLRSYPVVVVGGNCSIQGFDREGNEAFWTVTGDRVTSMELCDVNEDGRAELLVGSEDHDIRIYENEDVLSEVTETERIVALASIRGAKYGYALSDGTMGVYTRNQREWRVKSKNVVTALVGCDLDADGVPELVSGWDNGRIEVRSEENGNVVFRDQLESPVTALVKSDYRLDGNEEVIVCSKSGEVRGYVPREVHASGLVDKELQDESIRLVSSRKQDLLQELRQHENSIKQLKEGKGQSEAGLIPTTTRVMCDLDINIDTKSVNLILETNNRTVVRSVVVQGEALFDSDVIMSHPSQPQSQLRLPLHPRRNVAVDLKVTALVGMTGSRLFHAFDLKKRLPRFAMYILDPTGKNFHQPSSKAIINIPDLRVANLVKWLSVSFLAQFDALASAKTIDVQFVSLRDSNSLRIQCDGTQVTFSTDDMELAANLVEDLAVFVGVEELECVADFEAEYQRLGTVLAQVDQFHQTRQRLTADIADSSALVKSLVVKAEDARLLSDWQAMKSAYQRVMDVNHDLNGDYMKRSANHDELLKSLGVVSKAIERVSRLRVGSARGRVVKLCRQCVKANNPQRLFHVMKTGK